MVVDVKLQVGRWPLYLSVWDAAKIAPPTDQPNGSTSARVQSSRWFWAKHGTSFSIHELLATKALTDSPVTTHQLHFAKMRRLTAHTTYPGGQ